MATSLFSFTVAVLVEDATASDKVTVTPPGGTAIPLTFDAINQDVFWADWSSLPNSSQFPEGDYFFEFNGGADWVTLTHLRDRPPAGFVDIIFPEHGGTTSTTPTITWKLCDGCADDDSLWIEENTREAFWEERFPPDEVPYTPPNELIAGQWYELEMGIYTKDSVYTSTDNLMDDFTYMSSYRYDTQVEFKAVPEPSTALLLATGLAGLAAAGRRRRLQER